MKARTYLRLLFACSLVVPAACDVKDSIFETPHPEHGALTLTTDWSARGEGVPVPASYTVEATPAGTASAAYTATLSETTCLLDHLFAPGKHSIRVYNTPQHITVSGTTATVAAATTPPAGQTGSTLFVHNDPEWLFTSAGEALVEKDKAAQPHTAVMRQQVRRLTLIIEPRGETAARIAGITGALSGVAGTLEMGDGTHGTPSAVALAFSPITEGTDAGRWQATVRLLGTAGAEQRLRATILFEDGTPQALTLDSDLSAALATFNADKRTPCVLGGSVVETPTGTDIGATITDWTPAGGGPVTAD